MGSFASVWCMVWTGFFGKEGRERRGEVIMKFSRSSFFLIWDFLQ